MNEAPRKHPILLVDDEPEILFSLKGLLRREFELHTAESGQEALEILKKHPIHVVMTDQRMPEMTGVQLMQQVSNEHPEAIRIVFTGYADIKAVIDAINSGGLYRYITKPWDPDELVGVLHEAANRYDDVVEHKRLMADLAQHIRRGQELAERLPTSGAGSEPMEFDLGKFSESASQLLERLDRVRQFDRR
jgi:DNA-binding NtrC family response regulator